MRLMSLTGLLLLLLAGTSLADVAVQTDWKGGPGIGGPVTDWSDRFSIGNDLDWDTTPGQLKLIVEEGEYPIDTAVDYAYGCALMDIDIDGDMDIAACSYNGFWVHWWENTGGGESWSEHTIGTTQGPRWIQIADLDLDGDRDIIVSAGISNEIVWWESRSGGSSWITHVLESDFDARQIFVADFDGDGDSDILGVSSETGDVVWWRNRLNQSLPWLKNYIDGSLTGAYACHAADIDLDGDMDVAASSTSLNDIVIYTNDLQYSGSWLKNVIDADNSNPTCVHFANIDSDARPELLVASAEGLVFYDYSGMSWTYNVIDNSINNAASVTSVDVDGDGDLDLGMVCGGSFNDVYWYQNLPGTTWERNMIDSNFQSPNCIVAGDVNGDNVPDFAGTAGWDDRVSWWKVAGFSTPGTLESSIFDTQATALYWQSIYWSYEQPMGTSIVFNVRSSNNPSSMGAWSGSIADPGTLIGVLVNNTRYLQYKVTLLTTNPFATPSLKDVAIIWSPTGIEDGQNPFISLSSPNPCFGSCTINWSLSEPGQAELSIYDSAGRLVRVLENGWMTEGSHSTMVDDLPSGTYAAYLQGPGFTAIHRVVIID